MITNIIIIVYQFHKNIIYIYVYINDVVFFKSKDLIILITAIII